MIYNSISGEECIRRVIDTFNIKTQDWIARSNEWVASAMRKLELYSSLESKYCTIQFTNYRFKLPCDLIVLDAITYQGVRLNINNAVDARNHTLPHLEDGSWVSRPINNYIPPEDGIRYVPMIEEVLTLPAHRIVEYTPNNHGWVDISNVESGEIVLYYKRLPVEYSKEYQVWFPTIPDNEEVLEYIDWFILTRILSRGYKHEVYSLQNAQPTLNPHKMALEQIKHARSSARSLSADTRTIITAYLTTFLQNPNVSKNYLINR